MAASMAGALPLRLDFEISIDSISFERDRNFDRKPAEPDAAQEACFPSSELEGLGISDSY